MSSSSTITRLIDYILLVGPSSRLPERDANIEQANPSSWEQIFKPQSKILRRYPTSNHADSHIGEEVAFFCQPEGCCQKLSNPVQHSFMLTNTETNVRSYGFCLSFPCLVDPISRAQSRTWKYRNQDSVSIQEWGILTLCILSQHTYFSFFQKCLNTIVHFVDHFFAEKLSWDLLIHFQFISSKSFENHTPISEFEQWINRLLLLAAPVPGEQVMEVELEVEPAILIGSPPSCRLPLLDLHVHQLFEHIDVAMAIEIYKLLLMEQKVLLHSKDYSFVAQCVMIFIALLYPLQYLFPAIPLLPCSLPDAENLLMVPTPYFIGVSSSFLSKLCDIHRAEMWLIDLDNRKICRPHSEELHELPKFPYSVHQLQADIRHATDKLHAHSPVSRPSSSSSSDTPTPEDEVDVMIRIAFIEFLMGPELLGAIGSHLAVYRLFPRAVVSLKESGFLEWYLSGKNEGVKEFICRFIKSQSVEYFMEWSLNPMNTSFVEVQRGASSVAKLGDKIVWWRKRIKPSLIQETIYCPESQNMLYQEMLTHKASLTSQNRLDNITGHAIDSDDSDFEFVGREYDISGYSSSSSSFSDSPVRHRMTEVTVEFHPSSPLSHLDKIDFNDEENIPSVGSSLSPHNVVQDPLVKTPSNLLQNTALFYTPNSHSFVEHSSLSCENIRLTQQQISSDQVTPRPFLTPQPSPPTTSASSILEPRVSDRKGASLEGSQDMSLLRHLTPGGWEKGDGAMFMTPRAEEEGRLFSPSMRTVPWNAVSGIYELEGQIKELVTRISTGQGLPWPKPASFKKMIGEERHRVTLLKMIELRLRVRKQNTLLQAVDKDIRPVEVSKAVYRGICELLRLLIHQIEREFLGDKDSHIFSLFLVLRLALCISIGSRGRSLSAVSTVAQDDSSPSTVVKEASNLEQTESEGVKTSDFNYTPHRSQSLTDKVISTPPIGRIRTVSMPVHEEGRGECVQLHKELMKQFGSGQSFMHQRVLWNTLFRSIVDNDRESMGWNEKTDELYSRYYSLSEEGRYQFMYQEDSLLSIILHNLLVYMVMVGVPHKLALEMCQRLSAKTRLVAAEERLLNHAIQQLESPDSGLLEGSVILPLLHSETHPVVTYVVHHGISVTSPVYKLQICESVCILRRFPDEKITCRFWTDKIRDLSFSLERMTLSFLYIEDIGGQYNHHFHSKQYQEIFKCLQHLMKSYDHGSDIRLSQAH